MTTEHLHKLIGQQFTVAKLPVVYTIADVTSTHVHLNTNVSTTTQIIKLQSFLTAHIEGLFSYIGEPVKVAKEPVEEEPANFFSLDDL